MSGPATDRWMELRPYLDRALDLSPAEQSAYIESLRAENPALASELQTLLSSQRAAMEAGFLEDSPASLLGAFVAAGQTLGPYTLIAPIGQGGMGTVWLAERTDGRFRRKAAIKFLNAGCSLVTQSSDSVAKAICSRGSRIRTSPSSRMLGSAKAVTRTSCSNMSTASRSTGIATARR
jgi:hypothetical protein